MGVGYPQRRQKHPRPMGTYLLKKVLHSDNDLKHFILYLKSSMARLIDLGKFSLYNYAMIDYREAVGRVLAPVCVCECTR